jgi:hypothetical protein
LPRYLSSERLIEPGNPGTLRIDHSAFNDTRGFLSMRDAHEAKTQDQEV